jgi:hypothetical protein
MLLSAKETQCVSSVCAVPWRKSSRHPGMPTEAFLEEMIDGERDPSDPRMQINQMIQGGEGGLTLADANDGPDLLDEDDE